MYFNRKNKCFDFGSNCPFKHLLTLTTQKPSRIITQLLSCQDVAEHHGKPGRMLWMWSINHSCVTAEMTDTVGLVIDDRWLCDVIRPRCPLRPEPSAWWSDRCPARDQHFKLFVIDVGSSSKLHLQNVCFYVDWAAPWCSVVSSCGRWRDDGGQRHERVDNRSGQTDDDFSWFLFVFFLLKQNWWTDS